MSKLFLFMPQKFRFGVVGVGVAGISAHAHKNSQGGVNREHMRSAVA